jgi:hypothetical protein
MDPTDSVHLIRFLLPRPLVASADCNSTCERTRERQPSLGANQRAAIAIARAPSSSRSGGASGWRCGSIAVADVDAKLDGKLVHHTWRTDFPSAAGDSGSPVLDGDGRAAGILIATTPTQSLYSTVDWIATELHVRPCVTPNCD